MVIRSMHRVQPVTAQFTVLAETASLSGLRQHVRSAMEAERWQSTVIEAVVLALDEACANLVRHAFHGDARESFTVTLQMEPDALHLEICDSAAPFNPSEYLPQDVESYLRRHRAEKSGHGLGIVLMLSLMDEVRYVPAPQLGGANRLTLTKRRR